MLILTIRTDKPESEIGLFDGINRLDYETWSAHRELAETIHHKIMQLLERNDKKLENVQGVVCFKGPGSFTGLRIGLSVANALAYAKDLPIVGIEGEDNWLEKGIELLKQGNNDKLVVPHYGADPHITVAKK